MHTLNTVFPSNSEVCQNSSIKACEGMKRVIMRNGECTSEVYTLHEGEHKMYYLRDPFLITTFLRLASSAICDTCIWHFFDLRCQGVTLENKTHAGPAAVN